MIIFVDYPSKIWIQIQCTVRCKICSHLVFLIDVLLKMFEVDMP